MNKKLPFNLEDTTLLELILTPYRAICIDCEKKFDFRIVFTIKHEEAQKLIGKTVFPICNECYEKTKKQIEEIAKAKGFFFINYPEEMKKDR